MEETSTKTVAADGKQPNNNSDSTSSNDAAADAAAIIAEPSSTSVDNEPPLSKKALKRRKRWEKALEIKKRRKEQSKEIRRLKAKNEGRDLDAEREQQMKNEKEGKGWARREKLWRERIDRGKIDESFHVCFDCNFEDQMTWKEVNSLSLQLRYAYAMNRKSPMPVHVHVTGVKNDSDTRKHLEKVDGFPDSWASRAYHVHEGKLEDVFGSAMTDVVNGKTEDSQQKNDDVLKSDDKEEGTDTNAHQQQPQPALRPNHKLVYLTGDSENTLSTLDNNTTYVIGGIVDRNRLKRAAIERAEAIGSNNPALPIETARLPLDEHLEFKGSTRILTCNHVFEILLKYRENGYKDWGGAVLAVLPDRKDIQEKEAKKEEPKKDDQEKS